MSTAEQGAPGPDPGVAGLGHDRQLVRALVDVAREADHPLSQAEIDAALGLRVAPGRGTGAAGRATAG